MKLLDGFRKCIDELMVLTLARWQGQRRWCTERGRKTSTLSLAWKARKPLSFYSSSHPCFALYLFSFALHSILFSIEHLGPKRCQCCGYTHAHTRTHLGTRAPAERRQVHAKGLANSNTGGAESLCAPGLHSAFSSPSWRRTPKGAFGQDVFVHLLFVTLFCL